MSKAPNPFAACPNYRPEDAKYINCTTFEPDEDPCRYLTWLHEAKGFRQVALAVVPFVLSSLTLIFNLSFLYVVIKVVIRRGRSSRKRYSFLLSRAISTLLTQLLFYVMLVIWKVGGLSYATTAILLQVAGVSVFTHTGIYIVMTWLLYEAVVHPIWYKTVVVLKKCLWMIAGIWLIAFLLSFGLAAILATLFYPESAPFFCDYHTCQLPVFFCFVIIISLSYVSVIGFYVFMFLRMKMRNDREEKKHLERERSVTTTRNMKTMARLSLNLFMFSLWKVPLIVIGIVALAQLHDLRQLGFEEKSSCKTFRFAKLYMQAELVGSIALWLWLIGLGVDPVINIFSDPPLHHYLKKKWQLLTDCLCRRSKIDPNSRSNEDTCSGEF